MLGRLGSQPRAAGCGAACGRAAAGLPRAAAARPLPVCAALPGSSRAARAAAASGGRRSQQLPRPIGVAPIPQPHGISQPPRRGGSLVAPAMFDGLTASLSKAFKGLSADGRLSAENMKEPLRDVRRALLEADVSLPVVRRFIQKVEAKALGVEVLDGVTPQVAFVKVVSDELVELMGAAGSKDLEPAAGGEGSPQVVLLAGLQGVGKTTAAGKLAMFLTKRRKKVLLVATDVYRPAAIDQLVKLGSKIDVPVYEEGTDASPVDIAARGVAKAVAEGYDAVIVDTAGRLQVDEAMMAELRAIKAAITPSDTLLVVDAMTGQEAAGLVKTFNEQVDLTGAILTKLDGDSRGGAALSVREVSGAPIKFVGTGETMEALEPFYPERMANRILGMGDVLTLYEKAAEAIKEDEVEAFQKRLASARFDFNDFMQQFERISNMGGLKVLKLMPGFSSVSEKQLYEVEKKFKMYSALIGSMTQEERENPELLIKSPSRRRRVAEGAGRKETDVSQLCTEFAAMRVQMQTMSKMMKMGVPGQSDEALMKDLVKSQAPPLPPGKARRRKDKATLAAGRQQPLDKSKGFGAQR
ncbi:signal recognition particle [Raphidocelis subcapitata]|uniref:signal-recognition-particle GTPase n=1 Tax=Raphidocelis subcapitata TaxID=307507 RepID=A0A2V0P7B7_9CHLO|nr:signal recognition particle [Raphidocelis subcapitata]|eukprot:GBF95758.1 signal recognition particle [Raphidocelis subcapitata]